MRKLSIKETENISGGVSGALCFITGIGLATGGMGTIFALPTAIKCWNS